MRITESQLRRIIRQEVKLLREADGPIHSPEFRSDVYGPKIPNAIHGPMGDMYRARAIEGLRKLLPSSWHDHLEDFRVSEEATRLPSGRRTEAYIRNYALPAYIDYVKSKESKGG
jgi:hypothetical protein